MRDQNLVSPLTGQAFLVRIYMTSDSESLVTRIVNDHPATQSEANSQRIPRAVLSFHGFCKYVEATVCTVDKGYVTRLRTPKFGSLFSEKYLSAPLQEGLSHFRGKLLRRGNC